MADATVSDPGGLKESMDDLLPGRLAADLDSAFEALVLTHQDRLYSIALRILGDTGDAEEAAQDALVRAYRAIASYPDERIRALRLRPWLAAIVVNLCRNRATRRRRPPSVSLEAPTADGLSVGSTLADDHPERLPESSTSRRETVEWWAGLVRALPERYRIPIVLRHVDGLSFPEIAQALGRPEGTLKAQVHRGLSMLRAANDAAERSQRLAREEMTA